MPFVSGKTQLEQLRTELRALEDLLPYLTESRRDRVLRLIKDMKRQIADHPLNNLVVMTPRKPSTPRKAG